MEKAVFIDRDGVINKMIIQKNGLFDSPQNTTQVSLVDGVVKVISWLNKNRIPVIEVTNQPGVALSKMSWGQLEKIDKKIHLLLSQKGVYIDRIYRCFHNPKSNLIELKKDCDCRKPKSGMLIQAAREFNLDLERSVILGDNATDMEAGKNVGCETILFFHTYDIKEKVDINKEYKADFKVYSHQEVIPILRKLFE